MHDKSRSRTRSASAKKEDQRQKCKLLEDSHSHFLMMILPLRIWRVRWSSRTGVVPLKVGTLISQLQFSLQGRIVTGLVAPALSAIDLLEGLGKLVKRNCPFWGYLEIGI